jgi:hypothetical protein
VEHKTHKVLMRHLSDLLLDQVFTNVRQTGSRAIIFKVSTRFFCVAFNSYLLRLKLFLQMYCLECQLNDVTPCALRIKRH